MKKRMESVDWGKIALDSEIEYSRALKSTPVEYPTFTHMHNPFVPWGGDFNRAVGVKISNFPSFEEIVSTVDSIHQEKELDRPNRFDVYPPELKEDVWQDYLHEKGYRLETAIFFCATTMREHLPSGFSLEIPSQNEYMEWYSRLVQSRGYFDIDWYEKMKPLQVNFSSIFKPNWLLRGGHLVGWVYCAVFGEYARLFELEIDQEYRGQGMGILLLRAIRIEGNKLGARFILLQSGEKLRKFYEHAGFRECTRNSIIWLKG